MAAADLSVVIQQCEHFTIETAWWMNRHVPESNSTFWFQALRMRGFSLKKAFRVLTEYMSGTRKMKKIETALEATRERMWATELAGNVDAIDSKLSQAVVASMATAFAISYVKMEALSLDLVNAKTEAEVHAIFERYVTAIEQLSPQEFARMTVLQPDDRPIQAFADIAGQRPYVVPNGSGLKGWTVPVHEWCKRPRRS